MSADNPCFDVTLKGFDALCEQDKADKADELGLVRWVKAPNEEMVRTFLTKNNLMELVESITNMNRNDLEHDDGVDIILSATGDVESTADWMKLPGFAEWHLSASSARAILEAN